MLRIAGRQDSAKKKKTADKLEIHRVCPQSDTAGSNPGCVFIY